MAADSIIGIWSLNIGKSKFSPAMAALAGPPPKQHTETYREIEGNQIEFSGSETRADGSSRSWKMIWPAQGGAVKVEQGGVPMLSYVESSLGLGQWLVIAMRDGRQVGLRRKMISKDGKSMRQTVTGMTPDGKPIEQVEVYDRQ